MRVSYEATTERDGFRGFYYASQTSSNRCVIVLVGDDGNDKMDRSFAKWLNGEPQCNALCVAIRQGKKGDTGVHEWPLELVEQSVAWLKNRGMSKIGVLGMSIQAAMALSAAARIPDISLVIALSPCHFVPWGFYHGKVGKSANGEWPSGTSAFTWRGRPLPFQPAGLDKEAYWDLYCREQKKYHEMHSISVFEESERLHPVTEETVIPVEKINGMVILVGAEDDSMWNSSKYIRCMERRLREKEFSHPTKALIYPKGTHLLVPDTLLKKALPVIGGLVPRLFASGRAFPKACKEARVELDRELMGVLLNW